MYTLTSRLVAVLAVLLLAFAVGCGDGDSDSNSTSSGGDAAKRLSGTITVWDLSYRAYPDYTKAADQIDAAFEAKYPGVTVNHVGQVPAKYDQVLQAAFTGREGADVMRLPPGGQGVLQWAKGLEPLNDRISRETRDVMFGWEMTIPKYASDGDIYGIPLGVQGTVFYYNKELFKKAGLPTDFEPQTWAEVIDAGKKLKAAGFEAFTGGNREGYESRWWLDQGWQSVNPIDTTLAISRGEIPWTGPAAVNALQPYLDVSDAGLFRDDRYTTPVFPDGALRFRDGRAGMYTGLWSVTAYYKDFIPKLGAENVGVFFAPGSKYVGASPAVVWSMPSYTDKKDEAWAYIDFVTNQENATVFYKVGGLLPNRDDVPISPDAPPAERAIIAASRDNETFPLVEQMVPQPVMFTYDMEMNEVLQGRKSLNDALQAVQDAAEKAN